MTTAELHSDVERSKREAFDTRIKSKLGDSVRTPRRTKEKAEIPLTHLEFAGPGEDIDDVISDEDTVNEQGELIFQRPLTGVYLGAEVNLPQGDDLHRGKILRRSVDTKGNEIRVYDENPMLNTCLYDVQSPDGEVQKVGADIIAEHLYSICDENGFSHILLSVILDHVTDESEVKKGPSGTKRMRKSTTGWSLKVQWKDGTTNWIPLNIMKEYNPIGVAKYVTMHQLDNEPASTYMRACMMEVMCFESCQGYSNVWRRPMKKTNGETYYEYACLYTDDILVVSENSKALI